ncbi:MAG: DUF4142 domain-containing protein [Pirellulales bacterium]
MAIVPRSTAALVAAGVTCLLVAGYAAAQQVQQPSAPGQFGNPNIRRTPADQQQVDQHLTPGQPRTTHFRGPDAAGSTAANSARDLDNYIANCLIIKNEAEIKANEFAEQRADNPKVKQFARQMVDDHRQLVERLKQLVSVGQAGAPQASTTTGAAGNAGQTLTGQQSTISGNQLYAKLLELDHQITDQCTQMMQQKLGEKQGAEFDKCFVGAQVGAHMQMLAALEVISQQTTGQLQQLTHEAKAKVQHHLDQAEQLAKELEASGLPNRQARS